VEWEFSLLLSYKLIFKSSAGIIHRTASDVLLTAGLYPSMPSYHQSVLPLIFSSILLSTNYPFTVTSKILTSMSMNITLFFVVM
jgi:hypothetical protein